MYDIDALEQQWKRYRRKRLALPIVGVILLVVVLVAVRYFFSTSSSASEAVTPITSNNTATPAHLSPEVPSLQPQAKPASKTKMQIVFSDEQRQADEPAPSKAKKVIIEVTPKKSSGSVQQIESRFKVTRDKDDALFLARYYYEKKAYSKALKWALETNKIDSDIEESWLIFAKAKAQLGQRIEAIRVLQAYYDRSGSEQAKSLLSQIRRGKAF